MTNPPPARRGGAEMDTLTGCGSFDDKEVKDVFGRSGARVRVEVASLLKTPS